VGEVSDIHPVRELTAWARSSAWVSVSSRSRRGVDVAGAAGAEVGGDGGEFLGVARDEEEARALRGPDAAGGFGDAGGGAEDEDLSGWRFDVPLCWVGLIGLAVRSMN